MWKWILFAIMTMLLIARSGSNMDTTRYDLKSMLQHFDDSQQLMCTKEILKKRNAMYILYQVNQPEGFNLRRDVYIRLAVFMRKLQRQAEYANLRMVLPPWQRLYHWRSVHVPQQDMPWSTFFDVESMRRFAPILDFHEFLEEVSKFGLQETPRVPVHKIFQLLHFDDMFENDVVFDKFEFANHCNREKYLHGFPLQQRMLLDNDLFCVRFLGGARLLERVFKHAAKDMEANEVKIFAIFNAELVLHDHWGNNEFWRARRSMRFAQPLVNIAENFRYLHFNSTNKSDRVQRPVMWEAERPHYRRAIGGDYLCAHLRRGDFVYGRELTIPSLKSSATQIRQKMLEQNLTTVFLATDASAFELTNLKGYLQRVHTVRFTVESLQQKVQIKDGGIAIVDQLVCAHARYFIGTYESTFTYRIYEEREILGFPKSSTFNTFCKHESGEGCLKNSVWPIVY